MLGEIPKLFGRDYVIGYFCPALFLFIANFLLVYKFGIIDMPLYLVQKDILSAITIIGLITIIIGTVLLIINREVVMLKSGYGRFNPARIFSRRQRRRFERLHAHLAELDEEFRHYANNSQEAPQTLIVSRNAIMMTLAERYPYHSAALLPTVFGNILRSFEEYPHIMYGIDYTGAGWNALLTVIPKEFRELVYDSKAHMDFWVNI